MAEVVNTDECVGCGICVDACPSEAISLDDGVAVVNADECVDCGSCIDECPNEALSL